MEREVLTETVTIKLEKYNQMQQRLFDLSWKIELIKERLKEKMAEIIAFDVIEKKPLGELQEDFNILDADALCAKYVERGYKMNEILDFYPYLTFSMLKQVIADMIKNFMSKVILKKEQEQGIPYGQECK